MRVLVADRCADTVQSLTMLLHLWGHESQAVSDGPAVLEAVASYHPEVVLTEIALPGMSGYDVAKRVRELEGPEKPCLVAITGYGREQDCRQAFEAGFDLHLLKPADPEVICRLLTRAFPFRHSSPCC